MKINFTPFLFMLLLFSCHSETEKSNIDSLKHDSIEAVKREVSLYKELNATDFSSLRGIQYSIGFDTISNKRFFLNYFKILDIQKRQNQYFLKVSPRGWRKYIIYLDITDKQADILSKTHPEDIILVFQIFNAHKIDINLVATIDDDFSEDEDTKNQTASVDTEIPSKMFILHGSLISIYHN